MPRLVTRRLQTNGVANLYTTPSPNSSLVSCTPSTLPQLSPHVPQPLGSTPVVSSSSQNNDDPLNNHEGSDHPTPHVLETSPSIDKRTLIVVHNKRFIPKAAFQMLKIIVHSHFDGPYTTWTSVDPNLKEFWWKKWKKLFRWDEDQFPEEIILKLFNHRGSKHLKDIFQKARDNGYTRPIWTKEDIWVELLKIWKTDEKFQHRSAVNKRNRAVATEKGLLVYKGGSNSTTEHKRKLKEELGKDPNPKETFTRCYTRKDGTMGNQVAEETLDKFDALMEEATQDVVDGCNSVDMDLLWIKAAGGVKKDTIFGMGSEAHSMIQVSTYNVNDITTVSAHRNLREEIRAEFMAELASIRSNLEKVQQIECSLGEKVQQVESSLGSKVQQVENSLGKKVEQLEDSLQQVENTIVVKVDQMHKRIDNLVDKILSLTR